MKKILLITAIAVSASGVSSFAQGYFNIGGTVRGTWDLFTTAGQATPKFGGTVADVGLMWGSGTPLISAIQTSTATNSVAANAAAEASITADWAAIMNDPNFHVAVDANTSLQIAKTVGANGSSPYTTTGGLSATPVVGTAGGNSYQCYMIGWDSTYASPAAAAAAGAAVGWGSVFTYAAVSNIGTPLTMTASGMATGFGVITTVPEPASFALAGLGMAAMLVSRRRK